MAAYVQTLFILSIATPMQSLLLVTTAAKAWFKDQHLFVNNRGKILVFVTVGTKQIGVFITVVDAKKNIVSVRRHWAGQNPPEARHLCAETAKKMIMLLDNIVYQQHDYNDNSEYDCVFQCPAVTHVVLRMVKFSDWNAGKKLKRFFRDIQLVPITQLKYMQMPQLDLDTRGYYHFFVLAIAALDHTIETSKHNKLYIDVVGKNGDIVSFWVDYDCISVSVNHTDYSSWAHSVVRRMCELAAQKCPVEFLQQQLYAPGTGIDFLRAKTRFEGLMINM